MDKRDAINGVAVVVILSLVAGCASGSTGAPAATGAVTGQLGDETPDGDYASWQIYSPDDRFDSVALQGVAPSGESAWVTFDPTADSLVVSAQSPTGLTEIELGVDGTILGEAHAGGGDALLGEMFDDLDAQVDALAAYAESPPAPGLAPEPDADFAGAAQALEAPTRVDFRCAYAKVRAAFQAYRARLDGCGSIGLACCSGVGPACGRGATCRDGYCTGAACGSSAECGGGDCVSGVCYAPIAGSGTVCDVIRTPPSVFRFVVDVSSGYGAFSQVNLSSRYTSLGTGGASVENATRAWYFDAEINRTAMSNGFDVWFVTYDGPSRDAGPATTWAVHGAGMRPGNRTINVRLGPDCYGATCRPDDELCMRSPATGIWGCVSQMTDASFPAR